MPLKSFSVDDYADVSKVRFDFSDVYSGPDDPRIRRDLDKLEGLVSEFEAKFRGKLKTKLEEALRR